MAGRMGSRLGERMEERMGTTTNQRNGTEAGHIVYATGCLLYYLLFSNGRKFPRQILCCCTVVPLRFVYCFRRCIFNRNTEWLR